MKAEMQRADDGSRRARATDDDRERAAHALDDAVVRGSLDPAEHQQRVARAWDAHYTEELAALTGDLPGPATAEVARAQRDADLREWGQEWRWWLGGVVILSAIWGVQSVRSGLDFYWPLVPMGIWAAVLVAVAIWPRQGNS